MLCLRPVTGFAGHVGVLTSGTRLGFILMTEDACSLAGEGGLPLPNRSERRRTVMSVLAEGLRNDGAPNNHEKRQPGEQDGRGADQMAGIAKEAHGCFARWRKHVPGHAAKRQLR